MNSTFQDINLLLMLPLFTILGIAIFFGSCTYSYTFSQENGSSDMRLREEVKFKWRTAPHGSQKYIGPQNAQEIMDALDSDYNSGLLKAEVSVFREVGEKKITTHSSNLTMGEIDARYPRAEWLQLLLDRGITIENFHNYSVHLLKRHTLAFLEDNPDLRHLEIFDIPPTDDWETYKAAYIDKLVKHHHESRKS
ncbi:hypothetical protein F4Z99_17025 [Candidatus Poribacteria bacterium]|nr:hypothetical protein [Candidatus Poribacteria bacterium]MYB01427.1 hypothetical protein [Candidatus Poribacteria bacterium]